MGLDASNVVAWHDRTPEEHAALMQESAANGFRTRSLSLYGAPDALRFAAVMVKRPVVVATRQFGPVDQAGLQAEFDARAKEGWGPYLLTATGPAGAAMFAGCFTPMDPIPAARCELSKDDFLKENENQQEAGNILLAADAYGTPGDPRYVAIWGPNPDRTAWSCDGLDEDSSTLQARFDALTATGCRPALVSVNPAGRHFEMFVDSTIGPWSSRADMTSAGYQEVFDENAAQGRFPICVSAAGSGDGARFAAIFAGREETDPCTFRSSGPATVAAIDAAVEDYIRSHNLKGVALAITRGTRLVYAKGYTYAEPGYPDLEPTTLFRQASVSKTFAALAIWRLMQLHPGTTLDTTLQSVLDLKQPDGAAPKDARFADITLRHLLESTSGIPQGLIWSAEAAAAAAGTPLPATRDELASYIATADLTGTPGSPTNAVYGNTDYFLLGEVLAKLNGSVTFEQALDDLVLSPLGMTRTRRSVSLAGYQPADEAKQHLRVYVRDLDPKTPYVDTMYPLSVGPSLKHADRRLVPLQYGVWDSEMLSGCGGLSSAVVDVARLAAMLSDRVNNPVLDPGTIDDLFQQAASATGKLTGPMAWGYHGFDEAQVTSVASSTYSAKKGGWLKGCQSWINIATGGLSFAFAQNGNTRPGVPDKWSAIVAAAAAHGWDKQEDLFPGFGMPSLSPALVLVDTATTQPFPVLEEQLRASMVGQLHPTDLAATERGPRLRERGAEPAVEQDRYLGRGGRVDPDPPPGPRGV